MPKDQPRGDRAPSDIPARTPRLFVEQGFDADQPLRLGKEQSHYLATVLRLEVGAPVLIFNGRDGEWKATVTDTGRSGVTLELEAQLQPQRFGPDLHYLFAPLKHARLDYMVQKATEMGASRLLPVFTRRTQASRINLDRMRANAVEAAEQCGLVAVPDIAGEQKLPQALTHLEAGRTLIFCDEEAPQADPLAALAAAPAGPLALLIGPEGGFAPDERQLIGARANVVRLSLGPRILRADTAAVAALALVQAKLGDWGGGARPAVAEG
ncbi:ribosomal RNA small subunit methyltransferase E [Chelatococcus reniformis]|uniref:Ribosomal RNA small subunit methyltransferase E n=1 Tax=Chelatococcus reniformis TaxID=1494448 RepID=A0A916XF34_9HYPH|nr:ribosomal RNA small subunit methyltransferase E [Chelatococcus reniformis]